MRPISPSHTRGHWTGGFPLRWTGRTQLVVKCCEGDCDNHHQDQAKEGGEGGREGARGEGGRKEEEKRKGEKDEIKEYV